jgi:phosphoglycolate phosphatase-like HAD superfamily hydrolase
MRLPLGLPFVPTLARRAFVAMAEPRPLLRGVVFDMDGTLTNPNLDFGVMYKRCGVDRSQDILEAIAQMPAAEAAAASAIVEEMEEEGRRTLALAPGTVDVLQWLKERGIRTAVVTRNTISTVGHLHRALLEPSGLPPFWPSIARDAPAGVPPKPDTAALALIAAAWGVPLGPELLMVGDSPANDIAFGAAAGLATALVDSGRRHAEAAGGVTSEHAGGAASPDLVVETLAELPALLEARYRVETSMPSFVKEPPPVPATPAALAAAAGDVAALAALDDAAVAAADATGNTALIWAANGGHAAAVAHLLGRGGAVDVNARGYLGATALHRAARIGSAEVIDALLAAGVGADPDVPNDHRQYPLHFAAFKLQPRAVAALLKGGASTSVCDRKGRTPAEDTKDPAIRDAVLAARAERAAAQ